ncbi:MAG TPA: bifunctional DedA family/phosphatase PAP2 family protein [Thermoleophilaceae bacterium]|nr:bifunctional DedA family/phosphatase PAP2 family protein [Thermoleophilaceae bacterium]
MSVVRQHRGLAVLVAVAAVVAVLYATGAMPDFPDVEKLIEDVAQALGAWTYLLVGVLAFLETGAFVGLVAPGESVVIVGGVIAGQGEISLIVLIGIVWAAAILGDTTSFFIGRRLGRDFILRHGPKVKIDEGRLQQVESYFDRHGGKTILVGRFIGLVRALAPFVAGSSGLPYRRFIPFSIIGCGLWATTFCVLGYIFWESFDQVANVAGKATFGFGVTVAVIVGGVLAYRQLRQAEQRRRAVEWMEGKPLFKPLLAVARPIRRRVLSPAWAVVGPQIRFLFARITPGGLGLELTTTLAVTGVGFYVFTVYAVTISADPSTTPADRELLDLADRLNIHATLTDVAKIVTDLGSFLTILTLIVVTSILLAARRHWYELAALASGAILLFVSLQLAKNGIDRPRPSAGLLRVDGSSYPSGHAAYSTAWVAVAVVIARVIPGLASRAALVGGALVLAAAIGLSRIYLRVHYWSDVAGGWGLGAGVFGLCAAIALIVAYLRHNEVRPDDAQPSVEPTP